MSFFNYNGKILKSDIPVIGPDSRTFRYGDGLFETMKWEQGIIRFKKDHFERLWKGMQLLKFDFPKQFTPSGLAQQIDDLISKNKYKEFVRIRLQVFRGEGGLYDCKNNAPNYLIQVWQLDKDALQWNENGLVAGVYRDTRKICDGISNVKHCNYMPYVLAAIHAKQQRWNDAIILNEKKRICDTTVANIFIVKNNIIATPSLDEGCVEGIMRKNILLFLQKSKKWKIVEKRITEKELLYAEEVFVTNAIHNFRWIKQIDTKKYHCKKCIEIFAELRSIYAQNP